MALCDDLEAKLREERAAAGRLAEVLCREVIGNSHNNGAASNGKVPRSATSGEVRQERMVLESSRDDTPARNGSAQNGHDTLTQATLELDDLAGDDYAAARDLLAARGSLSNGDVQAALGLDAATARELLRRLVVDGVARTEGERRGMRYPLSE